MIALFVSIGFCIVVGLVYWRLKRLKRIYLEPLFMWVMLFGLFALCQPWVFELYRYGFAVLMTGTLGYIFVIHLR